MQGHTPLVPVKVCALHAPQGLTEFCPVRFLCPVVRLAQRENFNHQPRPRHVSRAARVYIAVQLVPPAARRAARGIMVRLPGSPVAFPAQWHFIRRLAPQAARPVPLGPIPLRRGLRYARAVPPVIISLQRDRFTARVARAESRVPLAHQVVRLVLPELEANWLGRSL